MSTVFYTLAHHLMTLEHCLDIYNALALDRDFLNRTEITACFAVIGVQLRHYYFKILRGSQKSLLWAVHFIARKNTPITPLSVLVVPAHRRSALQVFCKFRGGGGDIYSKHLFKKHFP
jgi:hypothetical protein